MSSACILTRETPSQAVSRLRLQTTPSSAAMIASCDRLTPDEPSVVWGCARRRGRQRPPSREYFAQSRSAEAPAASEIFNARRPPPPPAPWMEVEQRRALGEGLPVPESRAMGASGGRMPKRRGHAVSGCHDGIRERPATGTGSPERRATSVRHRLKTSTVRLNLRRLAGTRAPSWTCVKKPARTI